jgi:hypothetical protein
MYPKLIFDVDYTLYNSKDIPKEENDTEDITENFYTLFTPKVQLIKLLQEYKGEIYLFSNGNLCHVQEVIDKTNLSSIFKKNHIATLDNYLDRPKPYVKAYKYVIDSFNIKDDDSVYFFEDNLDNLKVAKHKYNWNTIFIDEEKTTNKKTSHYSFVDYTFKDALKSLKYLIPKLHKKHSEHSDPIIPSTNRNQTKNFPASKEAITTKHMNTKAVTPDNKRHNKTKKNKKNKSNKSNTRRSPFKHRKHKKIRKSKNNSSIIKQNRLRRLERLQENSD